MHTVLGPARAEGRVTEKNGKGLPLSKGWLHMRLTECRPGDSADVLVGLRPVPPEHLCCVLRLTQWTCLPGEQLCFCGKKSECVSIALDPAYQLGWQPAAGLPSEPAVSSTGP